MIVVADGKALVLIIISRIHGCRKNQFLLCLWEGLADGTGMKLEATYRKQQSSNCKTCLCWGAGFLPFF